jgi:hypothetical protein
MGFDGQLVAHGSRGYEECSFLAQEMGGFFLEGIGRGIFSQYIIPNGRLKHSFAHLRRGPGYRIASKVNESIHPYISCSFLLVSL